MLKIIFENEFFAIVDKPAGWLSVPPRFTDDPRHVVGRELEKQLRLQIYPAHRLDFEVSGLLLFAKNKEAHKAANQWFEGKTVQKYYMALTDILPNDTDVNHSQQQWVSKLVRGKKRTFEADHGQSSSTLAKYVEKIVVDSRDLFLWELQPLTGRSHQLRFEMTKHGYPIVGDVLYGSKIPWRENEIALRAVKLDFTECDKKWNLPTQVSVSHFV